MSTCRRRRRRSQHSETRVDLSGDNAGPLLRLGDRDDFQVTTSTGKLSLSSLYIFGSFFVALSNLDKFYVKNHVHNNFPRNFYILQYSHHRTTFIEKAPWYSCTTIFCPATLKISPLLRLLKPRVRNFFWTTAFMASKSTSLVPVF